MALLNYALTLAEVQSYLNLKAPQQASDPHTGEFAKIIFTGTGDIITHGYNYTQIFGKNKGLVPASEYTVNDAKFKFLANDTSWKELTVADLPMAENIGKASNTTLFTSKQVTDYFASQLSAVDGMRLKGVIDPNTSSTFPTTAEKGDTYRIQYGGTYAGKRVEAGDLVICIEDDLTGADNINKSENWVIIQGNINGVIEHNINGKGYKVYSPNLAAEDAFTIYAPKTGGTEGYVLVAVDSDATPVWKHASTLVDDLVSQGFKNDIVKDVAITTDGTLQITNYAGIVTPKKLSGRWDINISGSAHQVDNSLTLGTGFRFDNSATEYNGSEARQIIMTPATGSAIGGVLIDNLGNYGGLKKTEGDTISVTENGNIYLTDQNIFNALGYKPGNTAAVFAYANILTNSSASYTPVNSVNPFFNLTAAAEDGSSTKVASSLQFTGTNGIKVSSTGSVLNFDLLVATSELKGGIKLGYEGGDATRKYAVQLDENERAFVEVKWKDESFAFSAIDVISGGTKTIEAAQVGDKFTLQAGNGMTLDTDTTAKKIVVHNNYWEVVNTTNEMGYAPKLITTNTSKITAGHYMLAFKNGDTNPSWYSLPITALSDSWRAIKVNGVQVLDNTVRTDEATGAITGLAVDFVQGGKTTITNAGSGKIGISSTWRDIKVNGTEIGEDASFGIVSTNEITIAQTKNTDSEYELGFKILWTNLSTGLQEMIAEDPA